MVPEVVYNTRQLSIHGPDEWRFPLLLVKEKLQDQTKRQNDNRSRPFFLWDSPGKARDARSICHLNLQLSRPTNSSRAGFSPSSCLLPSLSPACLPPIRSIAPVPRPT